MLKHVLITKSITHLQGPWWSVFICGQFMYSQLCQHSALTTLSKTYMPRIKSAFVGVWGFSINFTFYPPPDCTVASLFIPAVCKQNSALHWHLTYHWKALWTKRALKLWKCTACLLPSLSCPDLWGPCRNRCRSFHTLSSAPWWDPGSPNPPVSNLSWACHSLQRRHTKSHRLINQIQKITDGSTVC